MDHFFNQIYAFIYGSLLGSFLNVVIYRLPRKEDLVFKRSNCPSCHYLINWYELFPVFSFLFLRGKCSQCGTKISFRYPITELILGLMSMYLLPDSFDGNNIFKYFFFISTF